MEEKAMKIASFVGTRPNINKEFSMNAAFSKLGIEEVIVHTGQHYDYEMSEIFFKELSLPKPAYHLGAGRASECAQMGKILAESESILKKEKPDMAVVYGDVTSTSAPAIAAVKCKIPVAHIEAGVRDKNLFNSEESNRRIADALSLLLFAPTREAHENLEKEGFPKDRIFSHGDVVLDALDFAVKKIGKAPSRGDYILSTIHRQENADSKERLEAIFGALLECKRKVKVPLHPRTKKNLESFGMLGRIKGASNIELLPPLGYFEFVRLLMAADKVVTDSGGVRREAYMLGKPAIVPIDIVWFPQMVEAGWMKVAISKGEILSAISSFTPPAVRPPIFGDGNAAGKIAKTIAEFGK